MVAVLRRSGMSRGHDGREVVLLCEECHSKMLAMGELLLLSCEARPVFTAPSDLELCKETFELYRDKVMDKLNSILITSRDVSSQVHAGGVQWKSLAVRIQELGALVTGLTELSAHIGYLVALNFPRSHASRLGVVNKYKLHRAKLDLKFCCSRLKRSCVDDLDPHLLVELCSTMSRALSSMTEVCRQGGERAGEVEDQNQFKLCVKSITSTTSCLIASVRRFKSSPSVDHLRRIIAFCDPVVAASNAVVTFASEEEFVGQPAKLSEKAAEAHKSVLGMTMSIVSASIQMCKAIRDLVYDLSSTRHRERIRLCVDSMDKASSKLRDLLLSCDFEPRAGAGSPDAKTGDTKPGSAVAKTGSADEKNSACAKSSSSDAKTASMDSKSGSSDAKCGSVDGKVSIGEARSTSMDSEMGSAETNAGVGEADVTLAIKQKLDLVDTSDNIGDGKADGKNIPIVEYSSSSAGVSSPSDAASCSSLDTYIAMGDAHADRLDLKRDSGDMERAVTASGLMASSPVLNLSTYSVGSISDVDLIWASQIDKSSPS